MVDNRQSGCMHSSSHAHGGPFAASTCKQQAPPRLGCNRSKAARSAQSAGTVGNAR